MYWIYGKHATLSALSNMKRKAHKILLSNSKEQLPDLKNKKVPIQVLDKKKFDDILGKDVVHQNFAVQVDPLAAVDFDYLESIDDKNQIVVVLDQVSDPQNVGGILRTAAAFGVKALIVSDRNSPKESGSLAKAASGALEIVPQIRVGNISQALQKLKDLGFWTIGFSEEAKLPLHKIDLTGKIALVMGSEGDGLRQLVTKNCDHHVYLPTEDFSTLNVATATAISVYQVYSVQKL